MVFQMYMDVHKEGTSLACGWEEAAAAPHNGESFFWKFLYLTNWEYDFSAGEVLHINGVSYGLGAITAILLAFEFIHSPFITDSQ